MFLILFLYDINNVVVVAVVVVVFVFVVAYAKRAKCHCAAVLDIYGCEDLGKDLEAGEGTIEREEI